MRRGFPGVGPVCLALVFVIVGTLAAQSNRSQTAVQDSSISHLRHSGTLVDGAGNPRHGVYGITFALYRDRETGVPLWSEIQNVTLDGGGHYSVVLGATTSGLPSDLFPSDEQRWLGVRVENEPELPRVLLVSVPYALTSSNADKLGEHPASDYVLASELSAAQSSSSAQSANLTGASPQWSAFESTGSSGPPRACVGCYYAKRPQLSGPSTNLIAKFAYDGTLTESAVYEGNGLVGIGTTTPAQTLQVNGSLLANTSATVGSTPAANGQAVIIPDNLDSVQSATGQTGQQLHFRLSRAAPDPAGAQNFLIAPYAQGMSFEYPGVLESWVEDFSVHFNHQFAGPEVPAHFWVGDEDDSGGLFATAFDHGGGSNSYTVLASDRFSHASHGSLVFQVRNPGDAYNFQWGPFNSEVTRASLSNTSTSTNLNLTYGSVQGTLTADSSSNGAVRVGSLSASPLHLVTGGSPQVSIFPDGNVSLGNTQDTTRLSVGPSGLFSVSDQGVVTATALILTSSIVNTGNLSAKVLNADNLNLSGALTASAIHSTGTVKATALETGALTATAIGTGSLTTPVLNAGSLTSTSASTNIDQLKVTTAVAASVSSDKIKTGSLAFASGTPIVGHISVTALLDFAAIPANSCLTQSTAVGGAADGDTVALGIPGVLGSVPGTTWSAWVSAPGKVSIRGCNAMLVATADPPPASIRVDVWKH